MKNFVLIGAAGFVAPRHMQAIKDVGGNLVAAIDPHDSVGILDSFFPDCKFFTEFERFDRYCNLLKSEGGKIDYVSICSPNNHHFKQCVSAMNIGADVICEKPLCLSADHVQKLLLQEQLTGKRVWNISQLRLGGAVKHLKKLDFSNTKVVDLCYNTPRGHWYSESWKNNIGMSGGLTTAIGIHLMDILLYLFGTKYSITQWHNSQNFCWGNIQINGINVNVKLSIKKGSEAKRVITIDGNEIELSKGFTNLHTVSYQNILDGNGIGILDVSPSVVLCEILRGY